MAGNPDFATEPELELGFPHLADASFACCTESIECAMISLQPCAQGKAQMFRVHLWTLDRLSKTLWNKFPLSE